MLKKTGIMRSPLDEELLMLLWQNEESLQGIIDALVPDKQEQKKIAEGRVSPPESLTWSAILSHF